MIPCCFLLIPQLIWVLCEPGEWLGTMGKLFILKKKVFKFWSHDIRIETSKVAIELKLVILTDLITIINKRMYLAVPIEVTQ